MKAMEVANFFIKVGSQGEGNEMTNARINKLLYFAQGWSLATRGKPLFDEDIEAWKFGPVVRDVYRTFNYSGRNPIVETADDFDLNNIPEDDFRLMLDVFTNYMNDSTSALIYKTHEKGTPWDMVYNENEKVVIPNELIKEYFLEQDKPKDIKDVIKEMPKIGYIDEEGYTVLPIDYEQC